MSGERTLPGWRLSFKPHGCSRYVSGLFLTLWLCGWVAGEGFALWLLVRGGHHLVTHSPPGIGREPLQIGMALAVGTFLLLWLTLWTIGGIAAFTELLRLWWGEDRIEVAGEWLVLTRIRGPFRTKRSFPRSSIRRIALSGRDDRLILDSGGGHVELSGLGTRDERIQGAAQLKAALAIPDQPSSSALPQGWEDIITPDGARVLVSNRSTRQKQARTAFIGPIFLATITFVAARDFLHDLDRLAPAIILLVFTLGAAAGTLWLRHGRWEWRIEKGLLTLRKRYGTRVQSVFLGRHLVLEHSTDSDGDPWFELYALSKPDPPPTVHTVGGATIQWRTARPRNRRTIARKMNDVGELQSLGHWLAKETSLELDDRTTPEARTRELAELRSALQSSGRFGRFAAKLVDRLADKTTSAK